MHTIVRIPIHMLYSGPYNEDVYLQVQFSSSQLFKLLLLPIKWRVRQNRWYVNEVVHDPLVHISQLCEYP